MGDSDPEDIFGQEEVRKTVTPYEIRREELEDPYRQIKVDLASLLNINVEPMSMSQICWSYSELFCQELNKKARKMGLTMSELFEAVSDTITPLRGANGETLYAAARSDKTKYIRSQIVQQNTAAKKDNYKGSSSYGYQSKPTSKMMAQDARTPQSRSVNNNNYSKMNKSIPIASLNGGPKSEERCNLIVKMVREHGGYHEISGRFKMRISRLQHVYAELLNNLPLWGSTMTEKEYADSMDSHEYSKYWQISSEKNYKIASPEDEFVYFIDVAPVGPDCNGQHQLTTPDTSPPGRPSLSQAAHRLIRNSLPSPQNSQLPCDRLPETRAELNLRRRDSVLSMNGNMYSRSKLHELSNICDVTEMVSVALKSFPNLQRKSSIPQSTPRSRLSNSKLDESTISPATSLNDSIVDQARLFIKNFEEQKAAELTKSLTNRTDVATNLITTRTSKTAVATDVEWLTAAPCIVNINQCNYISGTPMFFLAPSSVLFGVRNGNDDSERVQAINDILQAYFKTRDWSRLECKPGVPCIARCFQDDVFTYVRAIIVEADVTGTFECICGDITASINVDASDIAPLPNCFSVMALPPSVFVARIRGVASMNDECEIELQQMIGAYYKNTEHNVAIPYPSAVFGRVGPECTVDWVDPNYQQWMSTLLLNQRRVFSAPNDLESPPVDDAVATVKDMYEKGEFKYYGLEWCVEASELSKQEEISVKPNAQIDIGNISEKIQQVAIKSDEVLKELHAAQRSDNSARFLSLFKNMFNSDNKIVQEVFLANCLAFVYSAKVMMPTENWGAVLDEINKHFCAI